MSGETGTLTLASGEERSIPCGASNYLYCYEQDALVRVQLYKNNQPVERPHILERLTLLPKKDFDAFVITNLSTSSNEVRFFHGQGEYTPNADRSVVHVASIDDSPPIQVDLVAGSVTLNTSVPNTITPLDDVTVTAAATVLAAADADSISIILKVPSTAANGIRYGNSGVTATKGASLEPGESVTLDLQNAAVYGIRDGASNATVTVTKLERV